MVGSVRLVVKGGWARSGGKGGREEGCSGQGVQWDVGVFGFTYRGRWRRIVDVVHTLTSTSRHHRLFCYHYVALSRRHLTRNYYRAIGLTSINSFTL